MPSLISATERAVLTGIFDDIFDTFERQIIVIKEPLKTPVAPPTNGNLFGFGENQVQDEFTYTPVSGAFPAVIRYANPEPALFQPEMNAFTFGTEVSIKVRRDARDFIVNGKTDKVIVDERTFFLDSDEKKQTFLDSAYYVFQLRATK